MSGCQEFAGHIETGELRPPAISSAERFEGIDIPTLEEQSVDAELTCVPCSSRRRFPTRNKEALGDAVGKMVEDEAWQSALLIIATLAVLGPFV